MPHRQSHAGHRLGQIGGSCNAAIACVSPAADSKPMADMASCVCVCVLTLRQTTCHFMKLSSTRSTTAAAAAAAVTGAVAWRHPSPPFTIPSGTVLVLCLCVECISTHQSPRQVQWCRQPPVCNKQPHMHTNHSTSTNIDLHNTPMPQTHTQPAHTHLVDCSSACPAAYTPTRTPPASPSKCATASGRDHNSCRTRLALPQISTCVLPSPLAAPQALPATGGGTKPLPCHAHVTPTQPPKPCGPKSCATFKQPQGCTTTGLHHSGDTPCSHMCDCTLPTHTHIQT